MEMKLVLVTVTPNPQVKLISWPQNRVFFNQEEFEEVGAGDTNGFYDFLRLRDGHIVGVRFAPFVELSNICDSATPGPGLRIVGISPTASLELFWEPEVTYDHSLSVDQFFDWNYIFKSTSKKYAITFGFSHLPQNEVEDLLSTMYRSGE
jgi:hypothetical protein